MNADGGGRDRVELVATVLLAVATVATAWSGYQSTRWNGEQAKAGARANALRIESAKFAGLANTQTIVDVSVFTDWVNAYAEDKTELANFYFTRFRKEFKPAVNAWIATRPTERTRTLHRHPSPCRSTSSRRARESERLSAEAEVFAAEVRRDIQRASNYVLLGVVLFASSLFFAGMSTKLASRETARRDALHGLRGLRPHRRLDCDLAGQHHRLAIEDAFGVQHGLEQLVRHHSDVCERALARGESSGDDRPDRDRDGLGCEPRWGVGKQSPWGLILRKPPRREAKSVNVGDTLTVVGWSPASARGQRYGVCVPRSSGGKQCRGLHRFDLLVLHGGVQTFGTWTVASGEGHGGVFKMTLQERGHTRASDIGAVRLTLRARFVVHRHLSSAAAAESVQALKPNSCRRPPQPPAPRSAGGSRAGSRGWSDEPPVGPRYPSATAGRDPCRAYDLTDGRRIRLVIPGRAAASAELFVSRRLR